MVDSGVPANLLDVDADRLLCPVDSSAECEQAGGAAGEHGTGADVFGRASYSVTSASAVDPTHHLDG